MTAPSEAAQATLEVELVVATEAAVVWKTVLKLPAGASAAQAVAACGWGHGQGAAEPFALSLGARRCEAETVLRDGDRLELTRPLSVDPKEARRLRHRRDGLRPARRLRSPSPADSA